MTDALESPSQQAALPATASPSSHGGRTLSGLRKAAILVVTVGDEVAKKLFQNLPEPDVQVLAEEIADLRGIPAELSIEILTEFHELLDTQAYMMHGGLDYATKLLVDSFGKQRAEDLLSQVRRAQEESYGNLAMLQKVDPEQLGKFLDGEHPQTVALVLAHLDPKRASMVLSNLSEEQKVASVRRLAEMRQFSPEMAQKVALILHHRLENVGETVRKELSGFKAVADLMNRMSPEDAKKILERVEDEDTDLALGIRNLMFTFDDLVTIPAASIREIVSQTDKRQLGLALKGAREDLRAHIFAAMSSRAAEMLKEDMEVMGPVRTREVSGAQSEILILARKLEQEGKVILKIEQGDDLMV
jgi:flagellar motor switch protein FliG